MGWFSKPFYLLSTFLFHATHWMGEKSLSACFVFAAISRLKHSQISAFTSARFWHWRFSVLGIFISLWILWQVYTMWDSKRNGRIHEHPMFADFPEPQVITERDAMGRYHRTVVR